MSETAFRKIRENRHTRIKMIVTEVCENLYAHKFKKAEHILHKYNISKLIQEESEKFQKSYKQSLKYRVIS